jgi:hypothetical protein
MAKSLQCIPNCRGKVTSQISQPYEHLMSHERQNEDTYKGLAMNEISSCEARMDRELEMLRKMRLAMTATLAMFEAARDDLAELGDRMDRLRIASRACRKSILEERGERHEQAR